MSKKIDFSKIKAGDKIVAELTVGHIGTHGVVAYSRAISVGSVMAVMNEHVVGHIPAPAPKPVFEEGYEYVHKTMGRGFLRKVCTPDHSLMEFAGKDFKVVANSNLSEPQN